MLQNKPTDAERTTIMKFQSNMIFQEEREVKVERQEVKVRPLGATGWHGMENMAERFKEEQRRKIAQKEMRRKASESESDKGGNSE